VIIVSKDNLKSYQEHLLNCLLIDEQFWYTDFYKLMGVPLSQPCFSMSRSLIAFRWRIDEL